MNKFTLLCLQLIVNFSACKIDQYNSSFESNETREGRNLSMHEIIHYSVSDTDV